ncbi:MAG: hypothetical protein KGQ36_06900 [Rickettsiales bacterium]|nr:hypothetical protein [Rickettsiales bacterium]
MKKLYSILLVLLLFSCASKPDDPLIIPPNFSEMPDPNNPEKVDNNQKGESVERLKELLLKSDE